MKTLRYGLLGVAIAFMLVGPGIPNMSIPGVGQIQGFGQSAHAGFDDFIACIDESPQVGFSTRTACGVVAIASAFMASVTILTTALKTLVRLGWKKAVKYLDNITFTFPNKILGVKLPASVAGQTITIQIANASSRTMQLLHLIIMKPVWDLAYSICKCLVLGRY